MIDFKVDESLCVSCGACVKDCLHQALRMDMYPVMVDEGHCIRCQHCLAVCPTGAVSIMGTAASDCTPLAGNIPEPRQLDTLFKGRRSVRHYKRERFRQHCFKSFSTVRPMRLPAAMRRICWFRLSTTLRRWMPFGRLSTCVWTSWRKRVPCRTVSAARFPFRRKALEGRGMGRHFPFRSALRDRGQCEECDLRRAGPAHLSVVLRANGTGARDRHALVRPAVLVPAGRAA